MVNASISELTDFANFGLKPYARTRLHRMMKALLGHEQEKVSFSYPVREQIEVARCEQ
jgi:hypothetical protein